MRNYLIYIVISCFLVSCKSNSQNNNENQIDRHIYVNDSIYIIKGICYHPVPKGSPNQRNFNNLVQDLKLMNEAGINTIRVYEPIDDIEILNQIDSARIKVIIGFGYDQGGKNDIVSGTFIDYVNKFKNHNAILMWELGNEYNYHPEWFEGDIKNWYKAMNDAAKLIQENDSKHPTTTAHGDLPDDLVLSMSPNIDVWGMNVYRWDNPTSIFNEWKVKSNKPMYLSEAGADSYMKISKDGYSQGVNQIAQANATSNILNAVFENQDICSGVTLFSFTDGWWKAGNNDIQDVGGSAPNSTGVPYDGSPNEEHWGIVDIDREKKQAYTVVKEIYLNTNNQ